MLDANRRRPGLRLRAALAARHRRRPADPVCVCVRSAIRRRSTRSPRRSAEGAWPPASSSSCRTRSPSTTPQARITIDRDRAAALGVPVSDIGTTLSAARRRRLDRASSTATTAATTSSRRCRRSTGSIPSGSASSSCARRPATMVPLSARGDGSTTDAVAGGDRAVQPAQLGDHLGAAAAGRHDRRRPADAARASPAEVMPDGFYRDYRRPVAARGAGRQLDRARLRPRHHRHLSGARRAVRELPRPAHHHDVGAAVDVRRDRLRSISGSARSTSTRRSG